MSLISKLNLPQPGPSLWLWLLAPASPCLETNGAMQCHQHRCLFILFDAKQTIQTNPNFSELLFLGTASCFRLRFGSWLFFFFLANTGERIDDCIAPPRASNKKTMRQHQSQATDCQRSLLRLCSALCFCLAKFADGHVIQYLLTSVSLSLSGLSKACHGS